MFENNMVNRHLKYKNKTKQNKNEQTIYFEYLIFSFWTIELNEIINENKMFFFFISNLFIIGVTVLVLALFSVTVVIINTDMIKKK
jgi:hypothetical protein